MTAGRWFALSVGLLVAVAVIGTVSCVIALGRLSDARVQLADRFDPAAIAASDLKSALVDQETGIRGYVLSHDRVFLEPYERGLREATGASRTLQALSETEALRPLRGRLDAVLAAAAAWQSEYALPAQLDAIARPGGARRPRALQPGARAVRLRRVA